VGILNTLFSYSIYAFLLFIGLSYWGAATLSAIIGVIFNFKTTGRLVFGNQNNQLIFRFIGVNVVNYIFGISGLWIFNACGANMYFAGIIMIPPSALLSYVLSKKFVFIGTRSLVYEQRNQSIQ
jgi:putative flippase GtrA